MTTATVAAATPWQLPDRGRVAIASLIVAETAMFAIFVVAYLFYLGKSTSGPQPRDVLELPIAASIALWSSSATIHVAVRALRAGKPRVFTAWWFATIALGALFLASTAREWVGLIYEHGLTIQTNLFGTTFYALVGLHATHVIIGLLLLTTVFGLALGGHVKAAHAQRTEVLAYYWHFVDSVWIVVFAVVYVVGR